MRLRAERSYGAPAEVVFNTLTDSDRAGRWLPAGTSVTRYDADLVELTWAGGSARYRIETDADELSLAWTAEQGGRRGRADVSEVPAGGSLLVVETDGPADAQGYLNAALDRLASEVGENFTAG